MALMLERSVILNVLANIDQPVVYVGDGSSPAPGSFDT